MAVPLVSLPDCSGDGGAISNGTSVLIFLRGRRAGARRVEQLVQPSGVNLAAEKIGLTKDTAEKTHVGLDAGNGVLLEGAAKAGNRFLAAVAPGDEFAEKRVVIVGDGPAIVDAVVQADSRAAWNLAGRNFSSRGAKGLGGCLGVGWNFRGASTRDNGFPDE